MASQPPETTIDACGGDKVSRTLRVLALDGGAIRGYYTARLIERLLANAGADPMRVDVGSAFDAVVGTSAGAILGAALAAGLPVARICALYRTHGPAIFPRPSPTAWTAILWSMRHWRSPPADARALRAALREALGDETLGELHARRRIALCVTSTDITTSHGRVFATPHRDAHAADRDVALVEACLASSSAPMLFAPASIGARGAAKWCDGGVWANSPLWVAIAEAFALAGSRPIEVVSIGTCPVALGEGASLERTKGLAFWTRGVRALQLAADAQAHAVETMQPLLAHLSDRVSVHRLRDPEPDAQQASELRLDNPSLAAFAAMDALAERAAEMNAGNPAAALIASAHATL